MVLLSGHRQIVRPLIGHPHEPDSPSKRLANTDRLGRMKLRGCLASWGFEFHGCGRRFRLSLETLGAESRRQLPWLEGTTQTQRWKAAGCRPGLRQCGRHLVTGGSVRASEKHHNDLTQACTRGTSFFSAFFSWVSNQPARGCPNQATRGCPNQAIQTRTARGG